MAWGKAGPVQTKWTEQTRLSLGSVSPTPSPVSGSGAGHVAEKGQNLRVMDGPQWPSHTVKLSRLRESHLATVSGMKWEEDLDGGGLWV